MNHYHMNKSNQSLTQCHTGLSGARCKVNHQTASTQLTNLQSINTSKSTIGIQSHHLSYRSNTISDAQVQYVPLRPTFYFIYTITPLTVASGAT